MTFIENLDKLLLNSSSWQKMIADGIITDTELQEQTQRVDDLIRQVESTFSPEQQQTVQQLVAEINVLFAAYNQFYIQEINK